MTLRQEILSTRTSLKDPAEVKEEYTTFLEAIHTYQDLPCRQTPYLENKIPRQNHELGPSVSAPSQLSKVVLTL